MIKVLIKFKGPNEGHAKKDTIKCTIQKTATPTINDSASQITSKFERQSNDDQSYFNAENFNNFYHLYMVLISFSK